MGAKVPRIRDRRRVEVLGLIQSDNPYIPPSFSNVTLPNIDRLLASQGHFRLRNGAWSGGGPLLVHKYKAELGNLLEWSESHFGQNMTWRLGRPAQINLTGAPPPLVTATPPSWESKQSDLQPHYARGRARTIPGRPVGNVGQFLGELLREGVPAVPLTSSFYRKGDIFKYRLKDIAKHARESALRFKELGSEYLNVVFGWKPFLSDLRALYDMQRRLDKAFARLLKENGKGIHRKAKLDQDVRTYSSSNESQYCFGLNQVQPTTILGKRVTTRTRVTTINRWFSARYKYFIPQDHLDSWLWTKSAKAALLGLHPTPELIWELTPWSWLIDWFTNIDDIAVNLSYTPAENLYTDYSFVMEHIVETDVTSCSVQFPARNHNSRRYRSCDTSFSMNTRAETKSRSGGHFLFGLGITGGIASAYQLSILAALGISRSRA